MLSSASRSIFARLQVASTMLVSMFVVSLLMCGWNLVLKLPPAYRCPAPAVIAPRVPPQVCRVMQSLTRTYFRGGKYFRVATTVLFLRSGSGNITIVFSERRSLIARPSACLKSSSSIVFGGKMVASSECRLLCRRQR